MVDFDRIFDRPVPQIRGAKVDDVDEEQTARRQQLPYTREGAGSMSVPSRPNSRVKW
jgi:hypothetical protein